MSGHMQANFPVTDIQYIVEIIVVYCTIWFYAENSVIIAPWLNLPENYSVVLKRQTTVLVTNSVTEF